ncbi:DUF805 domain-containing protein [Photobacterium swingsii]|uniref:DUF805 domain-containing protein n=1 Tax=Photobacterium swingsii TaxID=680026 RepID=A0A0J8Y3H3_9GAMM|nr:DUF805 domain-containing protein [Photobacterium swingsii]KMV32084.1 inner membrane protein [Photobacterium swingsii]PSW26860.1 DUF805 domain-containing protein [Photobacterium swingsii]
MNQKWALFSFKGRMRRRDYWLYSLPVLFVTIPVFMYSSPENTGSNPMVDLLAMVVLGFVMWASMALNIKRLHDRNKSGWWVVVTFLPLIGPIFALVELGILKGTEGDNQFGPDPKGGATPPSSRSNDDDKDSMTIEM